VQPTPIKTERFSDGIMLYISLRDYENHSPCSAIFSLLKACGKIMLISLAAKTPIRGGLDVGTGSVAPRPVYPCYEQAVYAEDEPTPIVWGCPVCKDEGYISGWQETLWDKRLFY